MLFEGKYMKLTLETQRLTLRPFELSDARDMFDGWAGDSEATRYLTWNTHGDINETKAVLEMWVEEYEKPERLNFAIVLKETGALIGGIDVVGYLDGTPVIGYVLSRKYWGQGLMTEACKRLVSCLFERGFNEVRIDAMSENIGSIRVIEKCGGEYQRTDEEFLPLKNKTVKINRYIVRK